jgi:hypothetical protein
MKCSCFHLALLAAALFLFSGCTTLSRYDRTALENHNVAAGLYANMQHGEPLSLPDIVELSRRGLSSRFIIRYLHSTYEVYQLTTDDVLYLKRAGVSKEVIDYLLATPQLFGRASAYYDPWYPPYYPYYGLGYYSSVVVIGHRGFHHHHRH